MHSFKHAATLQHTNSNNPHPLLIRVDKKSGHGAGKSVEKRYWCLLHMPSTLILINCRSSFLRIQEAADKWGFVAQTMGLVWKAPQNCL
jgi:prolyl oligopeptidase